MQTIQDLLPSIEAIYKKVEKEHREYAEQMYAIADVVAQGKDQKDLGALIDSLTEIYTEREEEYERSIDDSEERRVEYEQSRGV